MASFGFDPQTDKKIRSVLYNGIDHFFDAITGKKSEKAEEQTLSELARSLDLPGLIRELQGIDNIAWGRYILSKDLLADRIDPSEVDDLVKQSRACGELYADRIVKKYKTADPVKIAEACRVKIETVQAPVSQDRIVFAEFEPPATIRIMAEPIKHYVQERAKIIEQAPADEKHELEHLLPSNKQVRELIEYHELFHTVEEQYEKEIFTRTHTIKLWKFLSYESRSPIRSLSEIAAGAFAQKLTQCNFNPYALDICLVWTCNNCQARLLFDEVVQSVRR